MKRILTFILLLALLLTAAACGGEPTPSSSLPDTPSSTTTNSGTESGTTTESAADSGTTTGTPTESTSGDASASVTATGSKTTTKTSGGINITINKTTATKPADGIKDYDLTMYTNYLWEGNTVYYETLGFVETAPGNVVTGNLLYTPTRVLSVKSCDLKTTYVEGKDYTVEGNTIRRTKNSAIPYCPYDSYAPK